MLYLVNGKLRNIQLLQQDHQEFVETIQRRVGPSFEALLELKKKGEILAGGIRAGSQDVVFILRLTEATSHLAVRQRLYQLPVFGDYDWTVTPLEAFEEWLSLTT